MAAGPSQGTNNVVVEEALLEDQLADIWPDYPCLYDVRTPEFKNRDVREASYQAIADKIGRSADWVKSKLKALRNSYVKAKKPPASGSARKNQTKRTTWLLEKLQFLASHVATRPSVSTLDFDNCPTPPSDSLDGDLDNVDDIGESDPNGNELPRSTSEPIKPRTTPRKRQADEEFHLIKNLSESISKRCKTSDSEKEATALSAFGIYVSKVLGELDRQTCCLAQNKINNIIFKAQAGLLSNDDQAPGARMQQQHQNVLQNAQPGHFNAGYNSPYGW